MAELPHSAKILPMPGCILGPRDVVWSELDKGGVLMRFLAVPLALLLGFSAPAFAADLGPSPMPTKAPPAPVETPVDYSPLLLIGAVVVAGVIICVADLCRHEHGVTPPLSP